MSFPVVRCGFVSYLAFTCLIGASVFGQRAVGQEPEDPRAQIWQETQQLLQRREFALAANLLENSLDDSELYRFTKRIQADLDAVRLLEKLSQEVAYSVDKIRPGEQLTVLAKPYRFDRLEEGSAEKSLVLNATDGRKVRYPLRRLDSATWLELADKKIQAWPDGDFVTGLFLAFDRYPNVRLARAQFNKVAESGRDVAIWIERLEQAEKERKQENRPGGKTPSANELILGRWSVSVKGGRGVGLVLDIRRGGDARIFVRGKRLSAKWVQEAAGSFRVTGQLGKTMVVHVAGNRIFGRYEDGRPFRGVRQAK